MLDGELEWLTDGLEPRDGKTIHEQIEESGAPALLLDHYAGRLRIYEPWRYAREVSHLFLGDEIDAFEADALLTEHGHGHLRLVDNGVMQGVTGDGRAYHLIPRAASKARAVARHMQARGYTPEDVIAVGDSREDLGAAAVVGTFWLVANALENEPGLRAAMAEFSNVRVAEASHGAGVYEAVDHDPGRAALSSGEDRRGGAVDVGLGRRPVRDRDAHRRLAVPAGPAHPARPVLLHAGDDVIRPRRRSAAAPG